MKRFQITICLLFACAICFSPAQAESTPLKTVRIAAFNFYPALFQAKDGTVQGFYVDFLNDIARREGWNIEYVYGNWSDGLVRIKTGEVDVLTNVAFTDERAAFMDYGKVQLLTVWAELYVQKGANIDNIRQVKGKKIALMKGDFNAANFRNLVEKFEIPCQYVEYGNFEEVFRAVAGKRVDGGIVNNTFGAAKKSEYDVKSSGVIFNPFDIYFAVAKGNNREIIKTLDKYLAQWRKDESSPYHEARKRWAHGSASTIQVVPSWLRNSFWALLASAGLAAAFILMLRIQVKRKTFQLNAEIDKRKIIADELHVTTLQLEEELAERQTAQEALQEQAAVLEEEIEERSRAEHELQETHRRLLLATTSGRMGVWDWNVKDNAMVWDDRMFELYGIERESFPACIDAWLNGLHPDDKDGALAEVQAALKGDDVFHTDFRVVHRDGTVKHLKADAIVLRDPDGAAVRMIGLNSDITEQKEWEGALEHKLELLTNPVEDAASIVFTDLFDLDVIQKIQDSFALATGVASIITDTGGRPITNPSNFSHLCLNVIRKTEKGLANCHRSDAVLGRFDPHGPVMQPCLSSGLLDGGASIHVGGRHLGNWLIGQVLDESCNTEKIMAYAREIGADEEEYRQALARVTRMPKIQFEKVCNALFHIAGQLSNMAMQNVNQAQHITERKASEIALQEKEEQYRALFTELNSGFTLNEVICDEGGKPIDYRFLAINSAFAKMLGMPAAQVVGKTILEVMPSMPGSNIERFGMVALTGVSEEFEDYCPLFSKHFEFRLYCPKQGQFAVIFKDVSDRKHLQEQLRQSQKMEAIGQLAGGVAHDFNNILTVIMGYCSLLVMDSASNLRQKEAAEQIVAASERASQLTMGLLAFSRKQVLDVRERNLNDIVQHVERFLVRTIGEDIRLTSTCKDRKLMVSVDGSQIEQVLINLATNARDAMPDGGLLTIETGLHKMDDPFKHAHGHAEPGRYACIAVSDTGSGMDESVCARIFEPFFTTKEVGKGTGLGMAIVYGIVQQHNGFIAVYSEPNVGTTFRIYLPISEAGQIEDLEEKEKIGARGGSETILLAEDDASVRALVTLVLTEYGYDVIQAKDGQEAVDMFEANGNRISLVLMDMIMPNKNGKEAYEEISRTRAGVKVLYSSGYTADFIKSRGLDGEGIELIMKPVKPTELLRKVRDMLDS